MGIIPETPEEMQDYLLSVIRRENIDLSIIEKVLLHSFVSNFLDSYDRESIKISLQDIRKYPGLSIMTGNIDLICYKLLKKSLKQLKIEYNREIKKLSCKCKCKKPSHELAAR